MCTQADYELSLRGKIWSAASYNLATLCVLALSLGLGYGLAGTMRRARVSHLTHDQWSSSSSSSSSRHHQSIKSEEELSECRDTDVSSCVCVCVLVLVYVRLIGYADFEAQRLESGLMVLGDPRLTGISNCIGADGQIDYVNGLCDASLSTAKEVRTRKVLLFLVCTSTEHIFARFTRTYRC